MKSIITAVLLIAAVGAGVYFLFLSKKKRAVANNEIRKDLIIGKWKLDSLSPMKDTVQFFAGLRKADTSDFTDYSYQFQPDGKVLRLFKDSVQKDNSSYEWTNDDTLLFKQNRDSAATKFIVSKLNRDSLILQSMDSTIAFFRRR